MVLTILYWRCWYILPSFLCWTRRRRICRILRIHINAHIWVCVCSILPHMPHTHHTGLSDAYTGCCFQIVSTSVSRFVNAVMIISTWLTCLLYEFVCVFDIKKKRINRIIFVHRYYIVCITHTYPQGNTHHQVPDVHFWTAIARVQRQHSSSHFQSVSGIFGPDGFVTELSAMT